MYAKDIVSKEKNEYTKKKKKRYLPITQNQKDYLGSWYLPPPMEKYVLGHKVNLSSIETKYIVILENISSY